MGNCNHGALPKTSFRTPQYRGFYQITLYCDCILEPVMLLFVQSTPQKTRIAFGARSQYRT